jgi:hypothetical protein
MPLYAMAHRMLRGLLPVNAYDGFISYRIAAGARYRTSPRSAVLASRA